MAAEKRSNASTPVVADPSRWDHIAADEAEAEILQRFRTIKIDDASQPLKCLSSVSPVPQLRRDEEEVPEELDEGDEGGESGGPLREMASYAVGNRRRVRVGGGDVSVGGAERIPNVVGAQGGGNRRMLPEAERLAILAGLKANHGALMELYNRMSVTVDTVSKMNR
ncbi:hypothetical protein HDU67_001680 [Dinochytrium kinnereticum]|nr:hypothetical protein HDU67_001680 [Dinochytrium kinnereticum]